MAKIYRAIFTTPNNTIAEYGQGLSEAIGANFDTDNGVLYWGDNADNGFVIKIEGNPAHFTFYPYINGTQQTAFAWNTYDYTSSTYHYVYYLKKDNDVVAFNMLGSNNTTMIWKWLILACVKAYDESNNEHYIYMMRNNITAAAPIIYWSDLSMDTYKTRTGGWSSNVNSVALAPIVLEEENTTLTTDYIYFATDIKSCDIGMGFILDGNEYFTLGVNTSVTVPFPVIRVS